MSSAISDFAVPDELPVLPLREMVVFPYMVIPLFVARERSIAALEDALAADRMLCLVAQRDAEIEDPEPDNLYRVGTVVMVLRVLKLADGRVKALVQGLSKARIDSFVEQERATWVRVSDIPADPPSDWCVESEALARTVRSRVEELLPLRNLPPEILSVTANVGEPGQLADLIASHLRLRVDEAQQILEIEDPLARLRKVDALLRRELDVTTVQAEIQSQAQDEMTRSQREHFLREQLRAIQAELGEGDSRGDESDDYRLKVEEAGMPEEVMTEALKQVRRLERMHPDAPEAHVVRSYLDWMVELPWAISSRDRLELAMAKQILDEDHAHLSDIKDRILEYLGVRKLRGDSRGPILCFVGPPGVGKTSLGRSIARSMGREFVRISLGGVRDEAEIRGHRRTYVGALPGRIVQGLKQAKTNNPVFMLDEIDKLGADYRGDPSSALLEVLDPEQNHRFSDHYLNVPFDLSKVLFIATANLLESIPGPLRDRMEVIRIAGYTPEEKAEIAESFLIPHQVREHGLPADRIRWSRSSITELVTEYTREAGVRNLERQIAAICRKSARRAAEGDERSVSVSRRSLARLLGPPPYLYEKPHLAGEIGVVNGLAWTESGGEILTIEATLTAGKGLVLTGQLGEVMKESGATALTWVRGRGARLGFDEATFARNEVHVHVPAGAIPKDGPSAGIAIATAIASIATRTPARADVAMTGEVTLRGRVLPIGGVREKALAALRAGITTVVLPRKNLQDLRDIPRDLKRRVTFVPVEHMEEVLEAALEKRPQRRSTPRPVRRRSSGSMAAVKPRLQAGEAGAQRGEAERSRQVASGWEDPPAGKAAQRGEAERSRKARTLPRVQLRDCDEFDLIARIERIAGGRAAGVSLGIGDDAALLRLRAGEEVVVTTDAFFEDVHFRWRDEAPGHVGRRAIVACLSDLAAMGARPLGCTLGLAAPPSLPLRRFDALVRGLVAEGARHGAPLVGGNLSRARETSLSLTGLGAVAAGAALTRRGTRAGDRVLVTGTLGAAALDRARAARGGRIRHSPEPRLRAGRRLVRIPQVVACIDISDGLAADLAHLLGPRLELPLEGDRLPLAPGLRAGCRRLGLRPERLALAGGEDYELLFTVRGDAPSEAQLARRLGLPVRELGRVRRATGRAARGDGEAPAGWRHF